MTNSTIVLLEFWIVSEVEAINLFHQAAVDAVAIPSDQRIFSIVTAVCVSRGNTWQATTCWLAHGVEH
ncbi:hypothetical protein D3C84_1030660 [compost metagenome]